MAQRWFDTAVPNGSLADRLNGKLVRLLVCLIFLFVVLSGLMPMMNQVDLGWQAAQGRWMLQHGALYSRDVFNYPNLDHQVVNEYPLFEVVLYLAWRVGWWGPCLLTVASYVWLVRVLLGGGCDVGMKRSAVLAVAIGLMLCFFKVAFLLRPHLVTFLCTAVLGVFLLRHREARNWTTFWPMALMEVAWVNSHSAFVLGPAMVGLFGIEMVVRRWISHRAFPAAAVRTWLGALLLMVVACFLNPYGWERLQPVLMQERLESIRAYVGEMEPVSGAMAILYDVLKLLAVVLVIFAVMRRRAIAWSFLLLALAFWWQAEAARKAWPMVGVFVPLLVLSTGALARESRKALPASWAGVVVLFVATVLAAIAVWGRVDSTWPSSIESQWREYDHGRSELSLNATAWMRARNIQGRLFHRCEDGGWLQLNGYDDGETFSDTGFGKFDEAFIHETGLVNERPALVPRFLDAYQPRVVVCSTFCCQWPYYLRQAGWRLIFYSPNSSVWAPANVRPDLRTITPNEVMARFNLDLTGNGMPTDVTLLGRNILALNSMGLEDFAFATLTGLPDEMHHAAWYWEAARTLSFGTPSFSSAHREALMREAEALNDKDLTADFRAAFKYHAGADTAGAEKILESVPPGALDNDGAQLLLKIYLEQNRPEALALARRTDCFELGNGWHWAYLAQAEAAAGQVKAAAAAWRKAVFYDPDDADLMHGAGAFAQQQHDAGLQEEIDHSRPGEGAAH